MENNKKSSLVYMACGAVLLAILGAFCMFIAIAGDFTPALGYFDKGSVKAGMLYAVLAAGVVLGAFSWFFYRGFCLAKPAAPVPMYTKIVSVILMVALLWHTVEDLFHIVRSNPPPSHWGLVLVAGLFALLFIVSLFCRIAPAAIRESPLAALSSFFPPFYAAAQLFILYFDESVATNSPVKIIYQIMYIAFMLFFTAQTGLFLGRDSIFPRYLFSLICTICIGGTVSVSGILGFATGTGGYKMTLSQIFFCFAVTIYALCSLLSMALSGQRLLRQKEEETA